MTLKCENPWQNIRHGLQIWNNGMANGFVNSILETLLLQTVLVDKRTINMFPQLNKPLTNVWNTVTLIFGTIFLPCLWFILIDRPLCPKNLRRCPIDNDFLPCLWSSSLIGQYVLRTCVAALLIMISCCACDSSSLIGHYVLRTCVAALLIMISCRACDSSSLIGHYVLRTCVAALLIMISCRACDSSSLIGQYVLRTCVAALLIMISCCACDSSSLIGQYVSRTCVAALLIIISALRTLWSVTTCVRH